ncbi:coiled-coil domain-containing protein 174-like [Glandiceps talaboti]
MSKKMHINASSLVDLKAELFRKQEQFKKEKLENRNVVKSKHSTTKKPSVWNKQNTGVEKRALKDKEEAIEAANSLAQSRSALEAKTALYDKMSKGEMWPEDDEKYMVDFTQKIIDKQDSVKRWRDEPERGDGEINNDDIPPASNPDEEWVDYVDSLGRTRRCMKKDLSYLQQLDKDLTPGSRTDSAAQPELLSDDMRREMLRKKWEEDEEEAMKKPTGPVHYENVRHEEVRSHGVGYFGFSREETERKKQFEQLQMLRDETADQRVRREKLKEKRKALLQTRLEKVKQRKKIKGELVTEMLKEPEKEPIVPVDLLKRDETVTQNVVTRPWDKGKIDLPSQRGESSKAYNPRDERPAEFAPPMEYYDDSSSFQKKKGNAKPWKTKREEEVDTTRMEQNYSVQGDSMPWMYNHSNLQGVPLHDGVQLSSSTNWDYEQQMSTQTPQGQSQQEQSAHQQTQQHTYGGLHLDEALSFFRNK